MQRPATREQLRTLVHAFYADVRASPELGPAFDETIGDRWPVHLERMVDFWSTVLLGSRTFRGNVFGKHMALRMLSQAQFFCWLSLWHKHTDALLAHDVAATLQRVAHGIARNLFYGRHGQFADFRVEAGRVVECRLYDRLPKLSDQDG